MGNSFSLTSQAWQNLWHDSANHFGKGHKLLTQREKAAHLVGHLPAVTGIDPNQTMIKRARAETLNPSIQFVEADFMQYHFDDQFDFISASASLHHMPFNQSLEKMASLLRPGGVLAVLGLFREASLTDRGVALVAVPVNVFYALSRGWSSSGAPTKLADMSLREIHESVSSHLPDACLHRLLLWRYLLTWQKPQEQVVA